MTNYTPVLKCKVCSYKTRCFFGGLTEEEYEFLTANKKEVDFKAGETIYKQGTKSKYLVFLLEGMAKVYIEGDGNKNFILELVKPFQFLDMPAIFDDDMLYRSSAAVTRSRACLIDIEAFKTIVLRDKKNVPRLIKHYNSAQSRFSDRLINVIYKNMEARIADTLLYLVNDVFFSRSFNLTISRSDLSELAGMSKESTSRILTQFKTQEIIHINGKDVEILNKKYLEQIARFG